MKLLFIIFIFISFNTFAQHNSLVGVYGECQNAYQCYQLKLKQDNTFSYYINEYYVGKGIVNGYWKISNDTLLLNLTLPEKEKPIINKYYNDTIKGKEIILSTEYDSLPMSNAKIIIDDTIYNTSTNNGLIHLNLSEFNKIEIEYMGLLSDTIFYLDIDSTVNLIKMYIPLSAGIENIYLTPTKWLIRNNALIPFRKRHDKYILEEKKHIKKVKRQKIVSQLKYSD